jgi:hypothetical protein
MKIQDILGNKKHKTPKTDRLRKSAEKQIMEIEAELKKPEFLELDDIYVSQDGKTYQTLNEDRKRISGRFTRNIGIDQATSGAGMKHAHVFGRRGKEILAVNVDGSGSHGTKGRLPKKDADVLRTVGFAIRKDGIVEWTVVGKASQLLCG